MATSEADILAFDAPFAKVVSTPDGEALLIGHTVFHVRGPNGNAADLLSVVLRRAARTGEGAEGVQASARYQSVAGVGEAPNHAGSVTSSLA